MNGALLFCAAVSLLLFFGLIYIANIDSGYTLSTAPTSWIAFDLFWSATVSIIYFLGMRHVLLA